MADLAVLPSHVTVPTQEPVIEEHLNEEHLAEEQLAKEQVVEEAELPPLGDVTLQRVWPSSPGQLAAQGWAPLPLGGADVDPLAAAMTRLFAASRKFFDQPLETKNALKSTQVLRSIGYGRDPDRKEQFTIRNISDMPEELRETAVEYWNMAGSLIDEWLSQIEASLELPAGALTAYSRPSVRIHDNEDRSTMLRLFRYETHEQDVIAEAHKDVGLMTIVVGDQPGLELGDMNSGQWYPSERDLMVPAATVLIGEELETLTNGRYTAGMHRVVSYKPGLAQGSVLEQLAPGKPGPVLPPPALSWCREPVATSPRYSLVYLVRSHPTVPIDTDQLTTRITGPFAKPLKMPAETLYKKLSHMI